MDSLACSLTQLSEQGHITATKKQRYALGSAGIYTPLDLLLWLPKKIIDKRSITPIVALGHGEHTQAQIEGTIIEARAVRATKQFHVLLQDDTGSIRLIWFHSLYLQKRLRLGMRLRCFGAVQGGTAFFPAMLHPSYQAANTPLPLALEYQYKKIAGVSNVTICRLIEQTLAYLATHPPEQLLAQQQPLAYLLKLCHTSESFTQLEQTRKSLMHEEFMAYAAANKSATTPTNNHFVVASSTARRWLAQQYKKLDFALTDDQKKACTDVMQDMASAHAMFRLLQGDVGCGKTIIAVFAAGLVYHHRYQACVLAPTTLLAQQHYQYFHAVLGADCALFLLTSNSNKQEKAHIKTHIEKNAPCIVIATHAVLTGNMKFTSLALLIADEQHRFGVHQRSVLSRNTDHKPHQLLMTATPIPRTFFMSIRGDIAVTNIKQRPSGRKPIHTQCLAITKRTKVMERVRHYCLTNKQQAYWICTLIDDAESAHHMTAQQLFATFTNQCPDCPTVLLHGQMKEEEKQGILQDVRDHKYTVVVATTVVEVGVHIEQAAIMVIENPERLGLAQLHQLRGRVGRGNQQGYCILLVGAHLGIEAKHRLSYFAQTEDGFLIAEYDFNNRGGGDLLGTKQSGFADFRTIDSYQDIQECIQAQASAPAVTCEQQQALIKRWFGENRLDGVGH